MTHILVVDDEPMFRELLPVLLAGDDRSFTVAVDGQDALAKAHEQPPVPFRGDDEVKETTSRLLLTASVRLDHARAGTPLDDGDPLDA